MMRPLAQGATDPEEVGNKLPTNIALGITSLVFAVLGVQQLVKMPAPVLGG
jgi:hypothetical protein